jgi:hypothetical protein
MRSFHKLLSLNFNRSIFGDLDCISEKMVFQGKNRVIFLKKYDSILNSPKRTRYSIFSGVSRLFKSNFKHNAEVDVTLFPQNRPILGDITNKSTSSELTKPLMEGRLPFFPGCSRYIVRLDRTYLKGLETCFHLELTPEERYDLLTKPDVFFLAQLKVLQIAIEKQDQQKAVYLLRRTERLRFLVKRLVNKLYIRGSKLSESANNCFKNLSYSWFSGQEYIRRLSILLDDSWFNVCDEFGRY